MVKADAVDTIKNWLGSGSVNIFGPPFAGKDTQAHLLGQVLDAPVIAGGDILRSHPDQAKIQRLMATGKLFPTDFYLGVVLPYLSKPEFTGRPLVLSSVGRWSGEEKVVLEAAQKANHPIKVAVWLKVDDAKTKERFFRSKESRDRGLRHDDAEHLIEVRINEFKNKTLPVIDFYKSKSMLIEIEGAGDRHKVTEQIVQRIIDYISQPR